MSSHTMNDIDNFIDDADFLPRAKSVLHVIESGHVFTFVNGNKITFFPHGIHGDSYRLYLLRFIDDVINRRDLLKMHYLYTNITFLKLIHKACKILDIPYEHYELSEFDTR